MKKKILAVALTLVVALAAAPAASAEQTGNTSGGVIEFSPQNRPSPRLNWDGVFLFTSDLDSYGQTLGDIEFEIKWRVGSNKEHYVDVPGGDWDEVQKWELAGDIPAIHDRNGTGAAFEFGNIDQNLEQTVFRSSQNNTPSDDDNYVDVVVYDLREGSYPVYDESDVVWDLSVSRGDFVNSQNSREYILDCTLGFEELTGTGSDKIDFQTNSPKEVFRGEIPKEGAPASVMKGSFGYVAKRFDAVLTLGENAVIQPGRYQADLTWTLTYGPRDFEK